MAPLKEAIPSAISANAANRFGWTLLMVAAGEGNTKIGTLLIKLGADVAVLNNFGESALPLAAHKGHLPFAKLLKSNGASSDIRLHGHSLEDFLSRNNSVGKAPPVRN